MNYLRPEVEDAYHRLIELFTEFMSHVAMYAPESDYVWSLRTNDGDDFDIMACLDEAKQIMTSMGMLGNKEP